MKISWYPLQQILHLHLQTSLKLSGATALLIAQLQDAPARKMVWAAPLHVGIAEERDVKASAYLQDEEEQEVDIQNKNIIWNLS